MANDQNALLLQMSADIRGLEKQMAKASGIVDRTATGAERRFKAMNDNMGRGFSPLRAAATSATSSLTNLAGGFAAVGPAGIAAGVAIAGFAVAMRKASEAAQFADDLSAAANKIGVTAEALQELRHAAESNDIPIEELDGSLRALNASIGAIQSGVGAAKLEKVFAALDIDPAQLKNIQTADQLLPLLADKFGKLGTQAEQVQLAKKLGIESLLPLLQQGAGGIDKLRQEARRLGLVMDEDVVQGAAAMNEELRKANERVAAANRRLGAEFIPTLVRIKTAAADAAGALAGMFSWLNRSSSTNPDRQIEDRLRQAAAARDRAARARAGSGLAAMMGGASGLKASTAAGREQAAQRLEAQAASLDREIEVISKRQQAAARVAADNASAAARRAAGAAGEAGGGGSSGRAGSSGRSRSTGVSGPSAEDLSRTRAMANLQEAIELAQAAANDENVRALQDQLDRLQKIKQYREDGLDLAAATAKADTFISARDDARFMGEQRRSVEDNSNLSGFTSTEESMAELKASIADPETIENPLRQQFRDAFRDGISEAIKTGDLEGTFRHMMSRLADNAADNIADMLTDGLFGGGGKGFGSLFSGLFKGGNQAGLASFLQGAAAANPNLFAAGTDHAPGGLSLVGERGPELLNIPRGAQVIPNDILRGLSKTRGSSSSTTTQTFTVNVTPNGSMSAADARRTGAQVAAALRREMGGNGRAGF